MVSSYFLGSFSTGCLLVLVMCKKNYLQLNTLLRSTYKPKEQNFNVGFKDLADVLWICLSFFNNSLVFLLFCLLVSLSFNNLLFILLFDIFSHILSETDSCFNHNSEDFQ